MFGAITGLVSSHTSKARETRGKIQVFGGNPCRVCFHSHVLPRATLSTLSQPQYFGATLSYFCSLSPYSPYPYCLPLIL